MAEATPAARPGGVASPAPAPVTVAAPAGAAAPKVAFKTLGCRLNQAESEKALEALGALGFDLARAGEEPDVVVINTCTVTVESTASSRRLIRKTAAAHPGATVVVTGCYAVADPEAVRAIPGVDLVVDNADKDRIAALIKAVPQVRRLPLTPRPAPAEQRLRTRVAIKAQTGCDEWCTFCIIPRTRGPLHSYPEDELVADVRRQVARGVREVVLTGVHLGKYGDDRGERDGLARLVDRLTAIDGLVRLRLSSVLPVQVTPALVERVRDDPKVCRHLHVPLQAGDDQILAAMHRPYRVAEFLERVEHAKAEIPGLGLSTDIIVGFPGETAERFAATLAVTERVGFSKLHVFRYSPRPGTPAATMPDQVPDADKKARARELIALGNELRRRFHERQLGQLLEVLVESAAEGLAEGTSDNYIKVRFAWHGGPELAGELATVRGTHADTEGMEGALVA
jgi:threonylcarbamoyladenosine tRNA methylthiotransferase MtaB